MHPVSSLFGCLMDGGSIPASGGQARCLAAVTLGGCVVTVPAECLGNSSHPKSWLSCTAQLRKQDVTEPVWPANMSK